MNKQTWTAWTIGIAVLTATAAAGCGDDNGRFINPDSSVAADGGGQGDGSWVGDGGSDGGTITDGAPVVPELTASQKTCEAYSRRCQFGAGSNYASMDACVAAFDTFTGDLLVCMNAWVGLTFASVNTAEYCANAANPSSCSGN
jgi:hypothetical protein